MSLRVNPPRAPGVGAFVAIAAACLGGSIAEAAVVDIRPYASFDWQSDKNTFLAPDGTSGLVQVNRPKVDDKVSTLVAGLDLRHDAGDTSTYLKGEGRRVAYASYDVFNHNDYSATLGHQRGSAIGNQIGIEFGAAREFTPFEILAVNNPIASQNRHFGRVFGVLHATDRNVFNATFDRTYRRLPIAGAPDFNTVENDLQFGYGRLVGQEATVGVRAMFVNGSNFGNGPTNRYRQLTPELYMKYNRAGIAQLDAALGVTRRTQDGTAGMKATVGNINLNYNLSAKTALRAGIRRQVGGYYVVGGSQTTTAYTMGIDWRPGDRLGIVLDAGRTHGLYEFPDATTSHVDDADFALVTASWKAAPWLTFGAFGRVQKRTSTIIDYRFDASSAGLFVKVQRP